MRKRIHTLPVVLLSPAFFFCVFAFSVSAVLSSCTKTDAEALARQRDWNARREAVSRYVSALPDEQKISQLFLVNIEGDSEFYPVEKTGALYGKRNEGSALVPGGCLLFSYNIGGTPKKIAAYTESIRRFYAENNIVPPYVAIDQEGGYVNRLRGITSNLVSQKKVTEWFTVEQAHDLYAAQARQLRLLGIQMNLAPVIEVETDENHDFLDTRSFGDLSHVLSYGEAVCRAYEENGIAVVLKHFPGNSNTDPHTGLPRTDVPQTGVEAYLAPFTSLAPHSSALLMSHIVARVHDENDSLIDTTLQPACFSSYWLSRARSAYADDFSALIFSDDIFMGALAKNGFPPEIAAVSAIEAGVNCIMLSEKQFGEVAGVLLSEQKKSEHFAQLIDESVCRVIALKIKMGLLAYEPVLNKKGSVDVKNPAYIVVPSDGIAPFDEASYKAAYNDGMSFYK